MARVNVIDHCPHCPDDANIKDYSHRIFGLLGYEDEPGEMDFPQWFSRFFSAEQKGDYGQELADLCQGNQPDADLPRYLIVETEMDDDLARFLVAKDPASFIRDLVG